MTSRDYHQCSCLPTWSSGINFYGSKLVIYIKVMILAIVLSRNQKYAIYNILSSNGWSDRKAKQHNRDVSQSICEWETKSLGKATAKG